MRLGSFIYCIYGTYPKISYNKVSTALMAQLDARLTGDQEVAGSTPRRVSNILS